MTHSKIERDKLLTEAMGECWHQLVMDEDTLKWNVRRSTDQAHFECVKCKHYFDESYHNEKTDTWTHPSYVFSDFSTWKGFGKLWDWCVSQNWWGEQGKIFSLSLDIVNPDRFANAVYKYLKTKTK